VACELVCYTEARPGMSGKKMRVPSKELRKRLGIDDIILVLQQNKLRWYGMCCEKKALIG